MSLIHPVILCGGSGTRLWPKSRKTKPKPFLPLVGERTLFEATLDRCADDAQFAAPIVVTGAAHLPHVSEQIAGSANASIIVEPEAKNTAAAIALAAARLPQEAVMLVCPSDHHIADVAAFREAAGKAAALAAQDWMVSFGITPDAPETGFGYIRRGDALEGGFKVDRFVEKPDLERAKAFLADGGYSWNGGIFAFRAGAFMDELRSHRPDIAEAVEAAVTKGREEGASFHPDAASFAMIDGESVDYAVMEKTARAAMVPVAMGWSDIGNFHALRDARTGDGEGNRVAGRVELVDCRNVLAESDGPRISVIGLEDVAVIVDGDEVLVTTMEGAQKVGKLGGASNQ
ncbi:mannose-1-phosphate guanylyltransferase [Alteraurantiacibacter aquimixticola]|uniref:Mannose-1-phosphate guanylyltransferase n=1 Tax=Alteraurantiacibacter aquimixticola TaxID=2489173 RepID=A0A4V4U8X2_9SPHN|nr:mannose-1-phosphate guanylyltransferase [Alteraurantiacibacter aquimixticola]TIX49540.1 mannose-1-phosphate guanylyltransferase [Alteraurantiacibacter aquimixticola]